MGESVRVGAGPTRTTGGRLAWRAVPWAPILVALVVAALATGVLVQVVHPFIRHDDWGYLLPGDAPGSSGQLARNRTEGRWLNTAYWIAIGQWTSPPVASAVFVAAHCAFVWGFVRLFRLHHPLWAFALTLGLFVSPMWVRLVYWPGTLSATMIVAATAVWTLPWARRRRWSLVLWVAVLVPAAVLTYPPVSALVFLALVVTELRSPWRRLALVAAGYVTAYGLGVLVVYTLNWFAFGEFGVAISAWRQPNPLVSVDALLVNLGRYGRQFAAVTALLGWAGVIALGCLGWALVDRTTRRKALVAVGGVAVVVALEAALTLYSGVVTSPRSSLWAWIAVCLPAGLMLKGIRLSRRVGALALAALAVVGGLTWRSDLGAHQQTRDQYDRIIAEAAAVVATEPGDEVVLWAAPHVRASVSGQITATTLQHMFYDQVGLYPRWCRQADCPQLGEALALEPRAAVVRVGDLVVVHLPRAPGWL